MARDPIRNHRVGPDAAPGDPGSGEVDLDGGAPDSPAGRAGRRVASPHPWYSRLLYALYSLAAFAAAIVALARDATELAVGSGVIGLVLLWKAAQRVR